MDGTALTRGACLSIGRRPGRGFAVDESHGRASRYRPRRWRGSGAQVLPGLCSDGFPNRSERKPHSVGGQRPGKPVQTVRMARAMAVVLPDGRRLSLEYWPGDGTPLVLLHGLLDCAAGWKHLAAAPPASVLRG